MKRFDLVLILFFATGLAHGQDNVTHQASYWLRYFPQLQVTEKLAIHAEVEERRLLNPDRQFQFFTHFHAHYKIAPRVDIAQGFNYNTARSNTNPSLAVPEWRPWQEVSLSIPSPKAVWLIRYRLDERFIHHSDQQELTDGYSFNLRHRLRLGLHAPIQSGEKQVVQLKVYEEVMINSTGTFAHRFDQNRITVGIEKQLSKYLFVELVYLHLFQSRRSDGYFDRHVARVTLFHRMGLHRAVSQS